MIALFAVAVARHLYRVAVGRKPSTLQRLADDAERHTTFVVSVTPRVADAIECRCDGSGYFLPDWATELRECPASRHAVAS